MVKTCNPNYVIWKSNPISVIMDKSVVIVQLLYVDVKLVSVCDNIITINAHQSIQY
jgi:hypothetical protein